MSKQWIETERLQLRRLTMDDADALRPILQDEEVMYAWEHAFSDEEVQQWLIENLVRYETDGYSYLAAVKKGSGELAGVSGLLTEHIGGASRLGIGWIFGKRFWGQGYAFETAKRLLENAFQVRRADGVVATIRPENIASKKLAERLGLVQNGSFVKLYRNQEIPHLIYEIDRNRWLNFQSVKNHIRHI